MIDKLKKWMYVNDIDNSNLVLLGEIIQQTKKEPVIFTRKGEILYYFWKLVNGKIKEEDFYMFNDTFFSKKIYNYKLLNGFDAVSYLKTSYSKNKIYVLDKLFKTDDLTLDNVYFI